VGEDDEWKLPADGRCVAGEIQGVGAESLGAVAPEQDREVPVE
jgi:hypothetical protein